MRVLICLLLDILIAGVLIVPVSVGATCVVFALGFTPALFVGNHTAVGLAPSAICLVGWVSIMILYFSQPMTVGARGTRLMLTRHGECASSGEQLGWAFLLAFGLLCPPVLLVAMFLFRLEPIDEAWQLAERAPAIRRMVAFVVDSVILAVCVYGIVAGVRDFCIARHFSGEAAAHLYLQVFGAALLTLGPLYGTLLEWATGATVGHRLFDLRVAPVGSGDKVSFLRTLLRNVGKPFGLTMLIVDFARVGVAKTEIAKTAKACV
ncbi:MAG: RDD family protein [Candidatus Methylacidiphilaceae bacterium]